ncbi:MAG: DivIVA domain-containing protein [Clostridia bacterium]|nr:DivIVA domain-containing protein [Clostridia bacterium]
MLTAEEIKNVSFKTTGIIMKGYDCGEVDGFVKKTAETFSELNDRIRELEEKLRVHEERADSVQNAIITAEMTAKALVKDASSKTERIMSEANEKSSKIIEDSKKSAELEMYNSTEKARLLLDNALANSAKCVSENNRIIDEQKIYITVLQDEAAKFKKAILDMYNSQLELIEKLPRDEDMKKYQKSMDEKYPTEQPVTADKVIETLKQEAENAVIPKKDEPDIKVEMSGDKENNSEASPQKPDAEIVFNSLTNENIKINYVNQNTNTNRKKNRNKNKRN